MAAVGESIGQRWQRRGADRRANGRKELGARVALCSFILLGLMGWPLAFAALSPSPANGSVDHHWNGYVKTEQHEAGQTHYTTLGKVEVQYRHRPADSAVESDEKREAPWWWRAEDQNVTRGWLTIWLPASAWILIGWLVGRRVDLRLGRRGGVT